jgi:branched-chain amino acid transport system permease protein
MHAETHPLYISRNLLKEAVLAAVIAALLFFHLVGLRTVDQAAGLGLAPEWGAFLAAIVAVFVGRILFGLLQKQQRIAEQKPKAPPQTALMRVRLYNRIAIALLALAIIIPFTPFSSRYVLDVITLILTYMILAYGLSLVVGMTGLLDLGFVAYYAIGAYTFALLAQYLHVSFWQALPIAMLAAMAIAGVLGLIVLRLRGDYYAIVTLGFAEILRILLLNAVNFTGGPNGITGIPRPSLFGLSFERAPGEGLASFSEFLGVEFEPVQRIRFLYFLAIAFCLLVYLLVLRLRRLPLGRSFEAVREDERAAEALGINLTRTKLAATMLAASCGALAGAFFAARQGFISPESFTFTESALVLAIVVLGGAGHPLGLALAAIFLVGLPEVFRELQDYRLIAFGAGMVLIMILRPSGLFSLRAPSLRFGNGKGPHA